MGRSRTIQIKTETSYCVDCHKTKSSSEFYYNSVSRNFCQVRCKECSLKERRYGRYGITYEQTLTLLEKQGGRCGICKRILEKDFHIDHDHRTNKLRGILCKRCNNAIGKFDDNYELLLKAAEYLIEYGS